jgi:hypothetical protein
MCLKWLWERIVRAKLKERIHRRCLVGAALVLPMTAPAAAEVIAAADHGFISSHEIVLEAEPLVAWQALTDVGLWWDASHSHSGDAANLSLDAIAGGCFCESLPNGGSVMHMQVVYAAPGKLLRLSGGLGPLQGMGVSGAMTFTLEPTDGAHTLLHYRYVVSGFLPGGLAGFAEPVDAVQHGQLMRLAGFLSGELGSKPH